MKIKNIWKVFFSPTGSTKTIIDTIAKVLSEDLAAPVEELNYTHLQTRQETHKFQDADLVIWGTPVYAGRIPNKTLPYIQNNVTGNGAFAVPVSVFGNRNYDDGLIELRNELEQNGFHTLAGAAIASRHCFSSTLGKGRPDEKDWEKIKTFAHSLSKKITSLEMVPGPITVSGNNPPAPYYVPKGEDGKPAVFLKAKPKTKEELCTACGLCVRSCPMGSIDPKDPCLVPGICIKCQACILKCPVQAKYFDDPAFLSHKAMLEKNFTARKEPEFFL